MGIWNEKLEKVLVNRKDDESPVDELCTNITKACVYEDEEYKLDEPIQKDEI